jgi:hypothetical protein
VAWALHLNVLCYGPGVTVIRCLFFAAPLLCGLSGCLLYTETFNVPPEVVLDGPTEVFRNQPAIFTAVATDTHEKPESLRYSWYQREVSRAQDCPTNSVDAEAQIGMPTTTMIGGLPDQAAALQIEVRLPKFSFFCVWVLVTDRAGAKGFAGKPFEVTNRAPTATVVLLSPAPLGETSPKRIPLFSNVRVSALSSKDPEGEPLQYRWRITGRSGEAINPSPCVDGIPSQLCHKLNASGDFTFELRVSDGTIESPPAVLPLTVMPDAPPCIQQTEPPFGLPRVVAFASERTNITAVEVTDDGDPFPAPPGQPTQTTFVWRYGFIAGGEPVRRVTNLPSISFAPDTFRAGDEIFVQLDVLDRVANRDFSACGENMQCQSEPGPVTCWQRVIWKVGFLL